MGCFGCFRRKATRGHNDIKILFLCLRLPHHVHSAASRKLRGNFWVCRHRHVLGMSDRAREESDFIGERFIQLVSTGGSSGGSWSTWSRRQWSSSQTPGYWMGYPDLADTLAQVSTRMRLEAGRVNAAASATIRSYRAVSTFYVMFHFQGLMKC